MIFFGLPVYLAGYLFFNLRLALIIHLALVCCFALLLLLFGRRSVVEMGVAIAIISILVLVLAPVFKRAEINRTRHQSTMQHNANNR
ncbi:MAG TPA: hypothetical protein VF627_06575 [Abditibacterium sp.]